MTTPNTQHGSNVHQSKAHSRKLVCPLVPNEGWYQNSYGTPGFPAGSSPGSLMSFLSAWIVPNSGSELLSGVGERFDTITRLNRLDACDCGCVGPTIQFGHTLGESKYDCT